VSEHDVGHDVPRGTRAPPGTRVSDERHPSWHGADRDGETAPWGQSAGCEVGNICWCRGRPDRTRPRPRPCLANMAGRVTMVRDDAGPSPRALAFGVGRYSRERRCIARRDVAHLIGVA
jgi:hypothetical protein